MIYCNNICVLLEFECFSYSPRAGRCMSTGCPGLHQAEFMWQSCCEALCKHSEIAQGQISLSTLSFRSHRTYFQYATLKANHITISSLNIARLCRKISSQAEILMISLAWLFQFSHAYLISDRALISLLSFTCLESMDGQIEMRLEFRHKWYFWYSHIVSVTGSNCSLIYWLIFILKARVRTDFVN